MVPLNVNGTVNAPQKHTTDDSAAGNASARTYVACRGLRVLAYYSLAAGAVEHADAPHRIGKGLARHPVPVMLIAGLAVDLTWQGRGLGKALVKDALLCHGGCQHPAPFWTQASSSATPTFEQLQTLGMYVFVAAMLCFAVQMPRQH